MLGEASSVKEPSAQVQVSDRLALESPLLMGDFISV